MEIDLSTVSKKKVLHKLASKKDNLGYFARFVDDNVEIKGFHEKYYQILTLFALGKIKNLIVTMPPQHGKSEGSTRKLPAFILGLRPEAKIAIASYNDTFASKFNKTIQRIIDSPDYLSIFPETKLGGSKVAQVKQGDFIRTSHEFEIAEKLGGLISVGRGGPLTGNAVDIAIMDDLYKDSAEANSPKVRETAWDWYTRVLRTRLHNDSQQLIVFTRWHNEDIIGKIEEEEEVVTIDSLDDIEDINPEVWVKINFQAIKEDKQTEIDPRQHGEALWPKRHSREKLDKLRKLDPSGFESMNQGDPTPTEGLLYREFGTYEEIKERIIEDMCIADVADQGDDYYCAVWYKKGYSGLKYVYDVIFSGEVADKTQVETKRAMVKNTQREISFESNGSGFGYARAVKKMLEEDGENHLSRQIITNHQSANKEAKILTNAPTVNQEIVFPAEWESRWPKFARNIKGFLKKFSANKIKDAADVLSEIVMKDNTPEPENIQQLN